MVVVSQYKIWSKQFNPKDTTPTIDMKTDMKNAECAHKGNSNAKY